MDCFHADVLILASDPDHPLGSLVRRLFDTAPLDEPVGVGSVLLIPEVLSKPLREDRIDHVGHLSELLARLDLRPLDEATARLASWLGAEHRLRAADAVHLATAVTTGADRFITNNRKDFPKSISEIDVTYPDDLSPR